jgi:hypothetical protein
MKRVRNILVGVRGGIREPDPEEVKLLRIPFRSSSTSSSERGPLCRIHSITSVVIPEIEWQLVEPWLNTGYLDFWRISPPLICDFSDIYRPVRDALALRCRFLQPKLSEMECRRLGQLEVSLGSKAYFVGNDHSRKPPIARSSESKTPARLGVGRGHWGL